MPAPGGASAVAVLVVTMVVTTGTIAAQAPASPAAVPRLDVAQLAGEWFEVAGTGAWSRRRCVADTRFLFSLRRDPQSLDVAAACTTSRGTERKQGRLRGDGTGSGTLRLRLVPSPFGLLPGVWDDFWVLAVGDDASWILVGDRRRQTLSVFSRTVTLDEAAIARAWAIARSQGFDVDRLVRVAHPAGATGLRLLR